MKPRVLIGYSACPLTRKAFEDAGCEAWTCDVLPARDNSPFHLQCDVFEAILSHHWDGAVLHPMCTFLTVSAAWAFKDPDYTKYPGVGYHQKIKPETLVGEARRRARDEALRTIESILNLPFPLGMENPATSFINNALRPPDQVIQPYQFGDDASKGTGLWLNGFPPLVPTQFCPPRLVCRCGAHLNYEEYVGVTAWKLDCEQCGSEPGLFRPRWANQTDSGQNRVSPSDDRWLQRSETYPGIAAAMGAQWGAYLNRS